MAIELRHLRYFKTVAEEGHITRAAEILNMQQPPLSLQIKALEENLGISLFKRLPRGVTLTQAGEAFYLDVLDILNDVDQAISKAQRIARGEQGAITIGFTSSVIFHPRTKLSIQKFRTENADIDLGLVEDGSAELVNDVAKHKLDVAFIRTNIDYIENIQIYQLIEEEIVAALPAGHPFSRKDILNVADLNAQPLILYRRSSGPGIYDRVISALNQYDISAHVVQEAPRVSAALNLVATGMGISFVPSSLQSSHSADVVYRSLNIVPKISASIFLACRKNEGSIAVKSFIKNSRNLFMN